MILFTDSLFLTDEQEGFRICRETRTTSSATMTVLYCKAGYADVYYHGGMIRINAGDLFVRIPDFTQPLGEYHLSPDFQFLQMTMNADIYEQVMYEHMRIEPNWWAKQEYVKKNPIFSVSKRMAEVLETYFHLLTLQLQAEMTAYRHHILRAFARCAAMEMLNYMDSMSVTSLEPGSSKRSNSNHSDYLFHQFIKLLQSNPHKREVQWYAKVLNITPKYLSEVCKERSEKSAGEWIADITVAELKHLLLNTTLPIHEIAAVMEFPNASFFCQYVKKHLGETPNKFRRNTEE